MQSTAVSQNPMSRIENDVETLRKMTNRVEIVTGRIIGHARSLGYFEPTADAKTQAPTPVITSLTDALHALDRAIDNCSGSLNVFD